MNERYYLYALARNDCRVESLGQGVDPRFPVEIVPCGRIAAVAGRVGLDKFDLKKLESGTTDVNWLGEVAVRHNQIVAAAARRHPVLPLRMGTLFHSRSSLLDKIGQWESAVIDFLDSIGDCREWAAKIYYDPSLGDEKNTANRADSAPLTGDNGTGALYLARKLEQKRELQAARQHCQERIAVAETALMSRAVRYCRTRPLPADLTGRKEKMLWNAAFLVPDSASDNWLELVDQLRGGMAADGLLLEVSGPWPPYHFCPTLENGDDI